jgi:hypothetical protein
MIFQFQSMVQAQGLVDLYHWSDNSTPYTDFININSSNSAMFIGNYNNEGGFNDLILTGSFDTTPGTSYQISFTLQDESPIGDDGGSGSLDFGNSEISLDGAFCGSYLSNGTYVFPAANYNFTATATSPTTTMSFNLSLDEGLDTGLSNLTITQIMAVPETSSTRLFLFGGCVFMLAKQLRKVTQKQKLAVKPII